MKHHMFTTLKDAIAVPLLGILFIAASLQSGMAQAALGLDHFECYHVFGPILGAISDPVKVTLEDQFDAILGRVEDAEILNDMSDFCNPASKTYAGVTEPILDNDAHLAFYTYNTTKKPITGVVKIYNQFGDQKLQVESADILAVPTRKLEPFQHSFSKRLDHFKCYFVTDSSTPVHGAVGVKDQFAISETKHKLTPHEPFLFCNPVKKTDISGVAFGINNPDAHLACYHFKPPVTPVRPDDGTTVTWVGIANQITPNGSSWGIGDANLLCVPTEKSSFDLSKDPSK